MRSVHILSARRTAVVPRNGAFADLSVPELGAHALRAALKDAGLSPDDVGEVIVSNALGPGGNPARSVALAAGLPERVGGLTIDRQCAGGLDAVTLGAALIQAGLHDVVVVGGVESYSRRPLRLHRPADGGAPVAYDQAPFTPWPDRDPQMADAAAHLARVLNISREAQDLYAQNSHRKTLDHMQVGGSGEITPLRNVDRDPFARPLSQRLAARAPLVSGSVTVANMAVAADGAAFLVLSADRGPVRFDHGVTLGGQPDMPGLAPVAAIKAVLTGASLRAEDLTSAEIMEAFAVQAIACIEGACLPAELVNPLGGALARGHPIGASGAVLAVSLFHSLKRQGGQGIASIASAGGLGVAILCHAV